MRAALLALLLTLPVLAAPLRVHVTVALCDNATQGIYDDIPEKITGYVHAQLKKRQFKEVKRRDVLVELSKFDCAG